MFMEIQKAMDNAKKVIKEVDEEYGKLFGRKYGGLIQCINCEDAKYFAVSMGAWSGDLIEAVNKLREEGYPIGVIRIRFCRPFPYEDIWEKVKNSKGVIVFDRSISFGAWGPLFTDLLTGLYHYTNNLPIMSNVVAGIGGVNITYNDFAKLLTSFVETIEKGDKPPVFTWYHKR